MPVCKEILGGIPPAIHSIQLTAYLTAPVMRMVGTQKSGTVLPHFQREMRRIGGQEHKAISSAVKSLNLEQSYVGVQTTQTHRDM